MEKVKGKRLGKAEMAKKREDQLRQANVEIVRLNERLVEKNRVIARRDADLLELARQVDEAFRLLKAAVIANGTITLTALDFEEAADYELRMLHDEPADALRLTAHRRAREE